MHLSVFGIPTVKIRKDFPVVVELYGLFEGLDAVLASSHVGQDVRNDASK